MCEFCTADESSSECSCEYHQTASTDSTTSSTEENSDAEEIESDGEMDHSENETQFAFLDQRYECDSGSSTAGEDSSNNSMPSSTSSSSDDDDDDGQGHDPGGDPNPDDGPDPEYGADPEEIPDLGGDPNPDGDPEDPHGDPDDPDEDADPESDDERDIFGLDNELLGRLFQSADGMNARKILAMILALSSKQHLDYKTTVAICRIFNVASNPEVMPSSKKLLWSFLGKTKAGITKHAYCTDCMEYFGLWDNLPRIKVCEVCGEQRRKKYVKYFITLSLKKQLRRFLSTPGVWEYLQHRQRRQKLHQDALEDIYDGEGYRALNLGLFDFSYLLNTDGFSLSKSSGTEAWALFVRLNELIPSLRQKLTFLGGLWIDDKPPDFDMFLRALVDECNDLSVNGIAWKPNGEDDEEVTSLFKPTAFCMDANARAKVLNCSFHSGSYGCPFCEHPGVKLDNAMKYPMPGTIVQRIRRNGEAQVVQIPEIIHVRSNQSIRDNMQQAFDLGHRVIGMKGFSEVMNLEHFDLGYGFSPDDLHPIYIGVTKFITKLIIEETVDQDAFLRDVDNRLLHIRTPTHMSRKPRSILKRRKWKGTEWRNWLLHFALVCMQDLGVNARLNLLGLLAKAVYLLSRDSVTNADINEAERCLLQFQTRFQATYLPRRMRFNIHILGHLPSAVRKWGPLHVHSTFPFESLNKKASENVSSPYHAIDQIVERHLSAYTVSIFGLHPDIDEEVAEEIEFILSGNRIPNAVRVENLVLFGSNEIRPPTAMEVQLLAEENLVIMTMNQLNLIIA
ncbi:hypothetical protein FOCC_FOCC016146 [Frankliniella occidentalis]|nr:hypothetical protein FOCC_FOCC016146 [Frankliniella occidentalis]